MRSRQGGDGRHEAGSDGLRRRQQAPSAPDRRHVDGVEQPLRLEGEPIGQARSFDAIAQRNLAILGIVQNCVQRDRRALGNIGCCGERRGPKNLTFRQREQAQLNGVGAAPSEANFDEIVDRFHSFVAVRRIAFEHDQRPGLR